MELSQWAEIILSSERLEDKLFVPESITDNEKRAPLFWQEPSRSADIALHKRESSEKLPSFEHHGQQDNRAACLHRFAGHELLAVELLAFAVLAYPEAPKQFRRSLIFHIQEEQEHVRLYQKRLLAMGVQLGDDKWFRHFWAHTPYLKTPSQFLSLFNLTLEQANLDFAPMYGQSFARHGDKGSAALMQQILEDEVGHVRLGWHWLKKLNPNSDNYLETWQSLLPPTMNSRRARGFLVHSEPRKRAGIPQDWIEHLIGTDKHWVEKEPII